MSAEEPLHTKMLRVAHYTTRRYLLHDFDPWDIVSHLWTQYHRRPECQGFTYMKLATLSYCYAERKKRRRLTNGEADNRSALPKLTLGEDPTITPEDFDLPGTRRWEIARMLSGGLQQTHICAVFGVKHNTISQTVRLMRLAKEKKNADVPGLRGSGEDRQHHPSGPARGERRPSVVRQDEGNVRRRRSSADLLPCA